MVMEQVALDGSLWDSCLQKLETELSTQDFTMWIRPLQVIMRKNTLHLLAPNRFVVDWITQRFLEKINTSLADICPTPPKVILEVGSKQTEEIAAEGGKAAHLPHPIAGAHPPSFHPQLNRALTFESFVIGKSNELARAASFQVAENPGSAYNPLFLYGGVGLGKTHLLQAIGNFILKQNPRARVLYLHSERFVADMVRALQTNTMNEFKRQYRSLNVLLIDDIQFFAGKDRSQEEFFHTFNSLLEGQQQIVLTSDRYPREISGVEERLKSRFGWGLTVAIDPPELETRVAILIKKAEQSGITLSHDVAFFIAKRVRSNVRELEGALKRVMANAHFTGQAITPDFAKEALRDLLALQDRLVTMENIQKTVCEYFKLKMTDLLSKRRNRSLARPRQIAMALAKELTNHSLPEIGDAFGGRDHTTVLHACRKIQELIKENTNFSEDYTNLLRLLTT